MAPSERIARSCGVAPVSSSSVEDGKIHRSNRMDQSKPDTSFHSGQQSDRRCSYRVDWVPAPSEGIPYITEVDETEPSDVASEDTANFRSDSSSEMASDVEILVRGARAIHNLIYGACGESHSTTTAVPRLVPCQASGNSTVTNSVPPAVVAPEESLYSVRRPMSERHMANYILSDLDRQRLTLHTESIPTILEAMRAYPLDAPLQKLGCFMLATWCDKNEGSDGDEDRDAFVSVLANSGALGLVVRALEQHKDHSDIKYCAKRVVNALNQHLQSHE